MTVPNAFFDTHAEGWEESCYPEPVRERLQELIAAFEVTSGSRVLDIGTGPGILIPYLRSIVGESGCVCAFDLSFPMVRQAGAKPLSAQDMVMQADVHRIPFKSGTFDHVICFAAFPHFSEPARALMEMSRVARPGAGIVIAHLLSRRELAEHHGSHSAVAEDVLPEASGMESLFVNAGVSRPVIVDIPGRYLARGVKLDLQV